MEQICTCLVLGYNEFTYFWRITGNNVPAGYCLSTCDAGKGAEIKFSHGYSLLGNLQLPYLSRLQSKQTLRVSGIKSEVHLNKGVIHDLMSNIHICH